MADAYTTYATMVRDAVDAFISTKMIELAERNLVLQKIAERYPLEQKMGKNLRVVQVRRLALPNAPLDEGVTPPTYAMTLRDVQVTVSQWGIVVALTDVVELTVKHPMLNIAIERVSMAMKETSERRAAETLMAATNVTYGGNATSRDTLDATDVFNTALAITVNAKLEMRGAPKYSPDGWYVGIFQPPHKAAILGSDQTFQQASNFAKQERLMYGYVGPWMGIDWALGNFLPVYVGVPAPTTAAATVTKAQFTAGTGGTLTAANYRITVVARDLLTDYERRISVQSANIAVAGTGTITVVAPSSVNYTYDIYMTQAGGTIGYLVASRRPAGSTTIITTAPTGLEAVAPTGPADGVSVYPGFVCGKGAFGMVELNGMSLQSYTTPKGASDSDPLSQRRKVGAKWMYAFFIVENEFIERFETSSSLAAAVPA